MADFSTIAEYYDLMTGFDRRLVNDFGIIKNLVEKLGLTRVLDAGCGTGVHSIILSKIGVEVVGLDASEEMIGRARKNALREGVDIPFETEYFETMPLDWTESFEGIFCLANSLVGVTTAERLTLAMRSFNRVLKPGGRAVIQLLNFTHFRATDRRIIKVSTEGDTTFVRFFDFDENVTRLNVIIIRHDMGKVSHTFNSEKILPISTDVMELGAKAGGFSSVDFYSDLTLSSVYKADGENLVAVLSR